MTRINPHWRIVFIALFLGLMSWGLSLSARADAAADYSGATLHCVNCHGTPAGTGLFKFDVAQLKARYETNHDLEVFLQKRMPKDATGACDAVCAKAMAAYLVGYETPRLEIHTNSLSGAAPFTLNASVDLYPDASNPNQTVTPVSVAWNFGDGSTSTALNATHTYPNLGTYTVSLSATDPNGTTVSTTKKVTVVSVHNAPVINTSKSTNLSGVSPLTANLDASLSTCLGGCSSYHWSVNGPDGAVTTRTFTAPGTYPVSLTVTDSGLLSSSKTLTVTVTASTRAPVANASKSRNLIGAAPFSVPFDAGSSVCDNECSSYAWNFGDGTSSSSSSPTVTHVYASENNYTVTLTVKDKSNNKTASTTVLVKVVPSELLTSYVQACQTELVFQPADVLNFDCYDGDLFATGNFDFNQPSAVRDFLGYKRITDNVDATFVCRWLPGGDKTNRLNPKSVELILHNHQNGASCFFSAKGSVSGSADPVSTLIASPTSGAPATAYWDAPSDVDKFVRCVGCHVSGAYIATPTIAPFLAKNGLMNNGHDTLSKVNLADMAGTYPTVTYHAVSARVNNVPNTGAFSQWDSLKKSYVDPSTGCSEGCHVLGTLSPQLDMVFFQTLLHSPSSQLYEINHAHVMEPFNDSSDYRWINLDTPVDGVETENFADAKNATSTLIPALLSTCDAPTLMEAHVVGSSNHFIVNQPSRYAFFPDKLATFNLRDGLTCLNADQAAGQTCKDYQVRYECTNNTSGAKSWVNATNHTPAADGDHEDRPVNACPAGAVATGIEASATINGRVYRSAGPNDRLARMSQYGLTCNNVDQGSGQTCSNYVVRYTSCVAAPVTVNKSITNVFASGKQLTATGTANNALVKGQAHNNSWNTQQWALIPVPNTEYVWLKNTGTNTYLNVPNQSESAEIVTYALDMTWTSEMWLVEPVPGSTQVRLKNLWTGKYLTMADPAGFTSTPDYLPVYSQALNTGWTSQRWVLQ